MGLLSFLERKPPADGSSSLPGSGDEVAQARTRARQRLIGAVVLVGIGIVAFPLLFESQPRPIPVDIPMTIADKDKVEPLVLPASAPPACAAAAPVPPSPETTMPSPAPASGCACAPPAANLASATRTLVRHASAERQKEPAPGATEVPDRSTSGSRKPEAREPSHAPRPPPAAPSHVRPKHNVPARCWKGRTPPASQRCGRCERPPRARIPSRHPLRRAGRRVMPARPRPRRHADKVEKLGHKTYTQVVKTKFGLAHPGAGGSVRASRERGRSRGQPPQVVRGCLVAAVLTL